jgi:putative photosynthetic complex assembly protein 2
MPHDPSLADYGLPVLYALFVWWFSTGVVLFLDGLPRRTFRWSLLGATAVLALGCYGLATSAGDTTARGAYVAFTCGVLVWGWHEMSFLMGFVTGPRKEACPDGCRGPRHVGHAIGAILYHELAILATALLLVALAWGAPNQVGTWTFLILWWMRLSTKLNVFLGVPNLSEEFLPEHLRYIARYFTRKPMNALFPLSVTASTVATAWVVQAGLAPDAGAFEVARSSLLGALTALGVLEHWFLVLPLPTTALWGWGLRSRELERSAPSAAAPLLHLGRQDPGAAFEQEPAKRSGDG